MYRKNEIIRGIHPVTEAVKSGRSLRKVYLQRGLSGNNSKALSDLLNKENIPFQIVPKEKLNRITNTVHQGVVALISPIEFIDLRSAIPYLYEQGKTPFILILDNITDVRNFGAIIRSAMCLGVDAVVIPFHGSAEINDDAVKTSAGAILKMNICREKYLNNTINFLKQSGIQILAATEKGKNNINEADFTIPTAVILGSESKGISKELLTLSDMNIKIPMAENFDSLNVSVSAGIVFYEALRQKSI